MGQLCGWTEPLGDVANLGVFGAHRRCLWEVLVLRALCSSATVRCLVVVDYALRGRLETTIRRNHTDTVSVQLQK